MGEEEVLFEAKAVNEVDAERSPAYTSMHWQKSCKRGTWAWARALPATVEPTALSEGERRLPWGADFRGRGSRGAATSKVEGRDWGREMVPGT